MNQNVRVSMKVEKTTGKENAHTQLQKDGERSTQETLVDRSAFADVISAPQLLFACRSVQMW